MAEPAGTRLGHYRLVAPIGSGGFATVYRAIDERLDSDVAVKVLAENHALDIEIRERFLREAQLLRRVACEAVVPVFDIGETDRAQPYMVLAFADRGDLRTRVSERAAAGNPVTAEDLMTVADVLAAALGRAHRVGLVHRDVKPTNLLIASTRGETRGRPLGRSSLLGNEERLLLGDLGLAKDLDAHSGLTLGGGTLGFNAPEQRTGVGRVDIRTDVYGASAVLYWMATRTVPPAVEADRYDGLRQAGLPAALAATIGRGLAEDPAARFDDIETWHSALVADVVSAAGPDLARAGTSPRSPGPATRAPFPGGGQAGPPVIPPPSAGPGTHGPPLSAWSPGPATGVAGGAGASLGDRSPAPGGGLFPGWRGRRSVALAGAALVAVVAAGWLLRPSRGATTELDDGRVRVMEERSDLTVAVTGPRQVAVGEQASFEASASGASSFLWVTPDGQMQDDNPLVLSSSEPGDARLTLVAADATGQTVSVEFRFTVTG
jgi:tRNA A-37 threonylcarbamoyl transferase component Bud32